MEEFSDLKFDGDLSFLNENLESVKKSYSDNKKVETKPQAEISPDVNTSKQQSAAYMERLFDALSSQSNSEALNNNGASEVAAPQATHTSEKKSQLEELILKSGYGTEMFNNLKMELLEMEKEKIIMKYKQDLMMLIIKS